MSVKLVVLLTVYEGAISEEISGVRKRSTLLRHLATPLASRHVPMPPCSHAGHLSPRLTCDGGDVLMYRTGPPLHVWWGGLPSGGWMAMNRATPPKYMVGTADLQWGLMSPCLTLDVCPHLTFDGVMSP